MGKTSYFCHVNAPLLVFFSMPGSFAGRENVCVSGGVFLGLLPCTKSQVKLKPGEPGKPW